MQREKLPVCGNPQCSVSTGIHEGLTFGSGELDFNGYWEFPCPICARDFEKQHPEYFPCWPFAKQAVREYRECDRQLKILREQAKQYEIQESIALAEYINSLAELQWICDKLEELQWS